jgi:hypothetical protein
MRLSSSTIALTLPSGCRVLLAILRGQKFGEFKKNLSLIEIIKKYKNFPYKKNIDPNSQLPKPIDIHIRVVLKLILSRDPTFNRKPLKCQISIK